MLTGTGRPRSPTGPVRVQGFRVAVHRQVTTQHSPTASRRCLLVKLPEQPCERRNPKPASGPDQTDRNLRQDLTRQTGACVRTRPDRPEPASGPDQTDWSLRQDPTRQTGTCVRTRPDRPEPASGPDQTDWNLRQDPTRQTGICVRTRPDRLELLQDPTKQTGTCARTRPDRPEPASGSDKTDWNLRQDLTRQTGIVPLRNHSLLYKIM